MKATDRYAAPAYYLAGLLVGLCLYAASYGQTPPAAAQEKLVIEDIQVYGNRLISTERIMAMLKTRVGQDYSQEKINEDVRTLFRANIGNVQPRVEKLGNGKVKVYFGVVEYPSRVKEIVYQGAKHAKPEELNTICGLRKDMPCNPIQNELACQTIIRFYNEKGRPLANCYLVEGGKPGDTRVVFNVTEGPKVKITGIDFVGNNFVSGPVLNTHVKSSRQYFGLFGGDYDPTLVELDESELRDYYRTNGFQDVKVRRELRVSPDAHEVTLIFHIVEGARYRFGSVDLTGTKSFSSDELLRLSKIKEGDFYNQGVVNRDKQVFQDYIGYTGRQAIVQAEQFYPPEEPGITRVVYQVQERPPARVGSLTIIGNDVTQQRVILHELEMAGIRPGQILEWPNMRLAERRLAQRGIFDPGQPPAVVVRNPDDPSEFKDVDVIVKETHTGSLIFGVGVNSDAGVTGSVVLNEKNFDLFRPPTSWDDVWSGRAFRGNGQEFRAEAMPGTQVQRYSVAFREPALFDSKYALDVGAYYWERFYNEDTESRLGGRIGISRRLDDWISEYWSASVGVRIENVAIHNVSFFAPEDYQSVIGNHLLLGFNAAIRRDARDSYIRPTEGNMVALSFDQVTGDYTYPLVNLEANQYFPVWQRADGSGKHVVALHSAVSWAGDNTPVYDRYYAGGYRSMRGFEFRGISPQKLDIFGNAYKVGGDFMLLNSIEYQVPLTANDQILAVAFLDTGTVESNVGIHDYRVSAGFGFRFTVPMLGPVPIALDFGFPIVKANGDKEQVFSFWLGFFRQ